MEDLKRAMLDDEKRGDLFKRRDAETLDRRVAGIMAKHLAELGCEDVISSRITGTSDLLQVFRFPVHVFASKSISLLDLIEPSLGLDDFSAAVLELIEGSDSGGIVVFRSKDRKGKLLCAQSVLSVDPTGWRLEAAEVLSPAFNVRIITFYSFLKDVLPLLME